MCICVYLHIYIYIYIYMYTYIGSPRAGTRPTSPRGGPAPPALGPAWLVYYTIIYIIRYYSILYVNYIVLYYNI